MVKDRFIFEWEMNYNPIQKSDIFYSEGYSHNPVVYISFNDRRVMISCDGQMNFYLDDTKVRSCFDLVKANVVNDTDWQIVRNHPDFGYSGLFPWFDAYEYNEDTNDWEHLDMVYGEIDEIILAVQRYLMER